ncbi:MAG: GWxTD domain-containing protein [Acidobacteriota bacterium]
MKRSISALALFLLLVSAAGPALAALEKYKEWEKSPEHQYLATDAEKKDWKKVASDEEAEKFIALFWARRDPDIKTPRNEFRERFDALVKLADERFVLGKKRGALTERGRLIVLIGPPKEIAAKATSSVDTPFGGTAGAGGVSGTGGGSSMLYTFVYDKAHLPAWADVQSQEIKFIVDVGLGTESLLDMSPARRLENKAAQMSVVNPDLKEVPVYKTREQAEAEQKAAVEAGKGPALAPASRAAIDGLSKEPFGPLAVLSLAYRDGATRLSVQLYAAATAVGTGEGVRLAIVARAADGSEAARVDEDAKLRKTRSDFFADRALRVLPGDYDVAAVLLDASGKVLVSGRRPLTVPALPTEFSASALVVAVNDFPTDTPAADDPFTFSARRFVVKGDGKLDPADGLSYAVRVYNPPVDPVSRTLTLKRTIKLKPKGQPPIDVPTPPEEPQKVPLSQEGGALVLDLAGGVIESNLGQYLKPNDYELRVTILDTVTMKKLDLVAPFTVVGSSAPAPAPAAVPKKKG